MKIIILFVLAAISTQMAHARKPAVEEFVGVETESYQATTPETEVLFNFKENLTQLENTQTGHNAVPLAFLVAFITLPALIWFFMTQIQGQNHDNQDLKKHFEDIEKSYKHDNVVTINKNHKKHLKETQDEKKKAS